MKTTQYRGEIMNRRYCDNESCGKVINGAYVKCSRSEYHTQGGQKLEHIGDLCLNCWKKITKVNLHECNRTNK